MQARLPCRKWRAQKRSAKRIEEFEDRRFLQGIELEIGGGVGGIGEESKFWNVCEFRIYNIKIWKRTTSNSIANTAATKSLDTSTDNYITAVNRERIKSIVYW